MKILLRIIFEKRILNCHHKLDYCHPWVRPDRKGIFNGLAYQGPRFSIQPVFAAPFPLAPTETGDRRRITVSSSTARTAYRVWPIPGCPVLPSHRDHTRNSNGSRVVSMPPAQPDDDRPCRSSAWPDGRSCWPWRPARHWSDAAPRAPAVRVPGGGRSNRLLYRPGTAIARRKTRKTGLGDASCAGPVDRPCRHNGSETPPSPNPARLSQSPSWTPPVPGSL